MKVLTTLIELQSEREPSLLHPASSKVKGEEEGRMKPQAGLPHDPYWVAVLSEDRL